MDKLAETQTPIHDLIRRRWSPRAFSERLIEPENIRSMFEAARWAPSSRNEQPWAYLIATSKERASYETLLGVLVEANRSWALKAPLLLLAVAHTRIDKDGQTNRHGFYDLGQATANLIFQATSLGIVAHQMGGFNVEAARERLGIPEGWEPVSMIALGYPGNAESLPESMRERETARRSRKPLEQFVFSGKWGQPASIVDAARNK